MLNLQRKHYLIGLILATTISLIFLQDSTNLNKVTPPDNLQVKPILDIKSPNPKAVKQTTEKNIASSPSNQSSTINKEDQIQKKISPPVVQTKVSTNKQNKQENKKPVNKNNMESINNAEHKIKSCSIDMLGQNKCLLTIMPGENIIKWKSKTIAITEILNTNNIFVTLDDVDLKKYLLNTTNVWHKNIRTNLWESWNKIGSKNILVNNFFEYNKEYTIIAESKFQLLISIPKFVIPKNLSNTGIISYYGYPEEPLLGILGKLNEQEIINNLNRDISKWQLLSPDKQILGALHIIVAIAQDQPTEDGTFLKRIPNELLDKYIQLASDNNFLVYLDIQIGWGDIITEIKLFEKFLKLPHVHLSLDPEYATQKQNLAPGLIIGYITGDEINEAQNYLNKIASLSQDYKKTLMIHQFNISMLRNTENIKNYSNVELSINMDGFGAKEAKRLNYELFSLSNFSEIPAIKLFYDWDIPIFTIKELLQFKQPPTIIMYQ
jgi:hypothetical protein